MPARIDFSDAFAPAEYMTKAMERPFRQDVCLNGEWQFQPAALPAGFQAGLGNAPALPPAEPGRWEAVPVHVPSPWNVNSFADHHGEGGDFRCYPSYPRDWETVEMGWLRKTFTVPADWKERNVALHFGAVAGDAVVVVNGQTVGGHFDIFLPFRVDVTNTVVYGGNNELLVGVRKASLFDKNDGYGRRPYQGGSFWGQHIAGIWQDVFLVATPTARVEDVFVQPDVEADMLRVQVALRNDSDRDVEVRIEAPVFQWMPHSGKTALAGSLPGSELSSNPALTLDEASLTVPAHGTASTVLQGLMKNRLKCWTCGDPWLYGLVIRIHDGGQILDCKYTRFGWRQITFRRSEVLLNGDPVIMRGDSWHFMGIPQMTRRYAWAWFTALHNAGLNAVRLHAQPYPEFYLDVADEMGILVLDETAVWASDAGPKVDDPVFWQDTERHLAALIKRDRNHPCVFGWSVCNEMRPIIRSVLRNPPGLMDELARHYGIWAGICRSLDPTRPWISADGDEDGEGKLPVFLVHYGGVEDMKRAVATGKPWGVGETGNAYYGSPEQVAESNGEYAYESFEGRMEGVALSSYRALIEQHEYRASYRSVFNLVWYGLRPLPLGLRDTTRPPVLEDGVFFRSQSEGRPGVQPERLGPYCSTLNPGYDPALPLYQAWPLYDAIRAGAAEPPVEGKWSRKPEMMLRQDTLAINPVTTIRVLAGPGSKLAAELQLIGVSSKRMQSSGVPQLLIVDGANPPDGDSRQLSESVCRSGGTVLVWGAASGTVAGLNALLPAPVSVTERRASSLLPVTMSPITFGLKPSNLYFCDQHPPELVTAGLGGPLIEQSRVLLRDCDTDWLKWNNQPEYAKTAMVLRSELEAKPSGVVLAEKKIGPGRLLVTTLPAVPRTVKAERVNRSILSNLGVVLENGMDSGRPLLKTGTLVRVLACGYFPVKEPISPGNVWDGNTFRIGDTMAGKQWQPVFREEGIFDLAGLNTPGAGRDAVAYLSFWVFSPRSLEDLLLEPNLPQVDLEIAKQGSVEVWLDGKQQAIATRGGEFSAAVTGLKLHAGWSHLLIRSRRIGERWDFAARLTASQPEFLAQLDSALERP